ncbi:MAG: 2-amino-4-hydroxy-6-hydroxymethyldihydropteridine diphosphokinase [Bacteroidales bacterium]|nr:2-amino-4-hydroxy-6-hydroxymethyldihydropteridine diphosphokinase [Bacteroidales bacterium]
MNQFIILLASNSEAEKNIAEARIILSLAFPEGARFSENHWSAALIKEGQPVPQGECAKYLNAVCVAQSVSTLRDIQIVLKKIELDMGRIRSVEMHGRVAIDLDLVEWNGEILRPKDAIQGYYQACLKDLM